MKKTLLALAFILSACAKESEPVKNKVNEQHPEERAQQCVKIENDQDDMVPVIASNLYECRVGDLCVIVEYAFGKRIESEPGECEFIDVTEKQPEEGI